MKYPIRKLLHDCFSIGTGASIIWIFVAINVQGYSYLKEDNSWIAYSELGLGIAMVVLGIQRYIEDLRRK